MNGGFFTSENEKTDFRFLSRGHITMRYGYEVQPDGTKAVHVFTEEVSRVQWIAACPAARGLLSGNSREVKAALYRDTVIVEKLSEQP